MEINKKELIEHLTEKIKFIESIDENMSEISWNYQSGVLISGNEAKLFVKLLNGE